MASHDSENQIINEVNFKNQKKMPWVIPIYCDGCSGCMNRCKRGVIEMTETNVDGVYVPWLPDPDRCSGCGQCTEACAMGAITMTSFVDKAKIRFKENKPVINS